MQAVGITITLNSFLQTSNIEELKRESGKIFSEILLNEQWEGVAFVALYDSAGRVILHSNPLLIGSKTELNVKETPHYYFLSLGTGEKVFVSDSQIKIKETSYILRIALHVYPVEAILKTAKFHIFLMFGIGVLLSLGGAVSIFLLSRVEKFQERMGELEKISVLSQVLAHEIRNPLGSIKGYAQYLKKKVDEKSIQQYLDIIVKESIRLENLTKELTNFATPPKLNFESFSLDEFLTEIVNKFNTQYEDINFEFKGEQLTVRTDRDKLAQILDNIIQNAVDAVTESGKKFILISSKSTNGKIKIEIKDTGIGIDEDIIDKITEPFFTTKPKGSGLGLAIVRKLCDALNIKLEIKTTKGKGTTVCLTLPK